MTWKSSVTKQRNYLSFFFLSIHRFEEFFSKRSPVHSALLLYTSLSSAGRNLQSLRGYKQLPTPQDSLGFPSLSDWMPPEPLLVALQATQSQKKATTEQTWDRYWQRLGVAGRSGPPYKPAGRGRRGCATARTCSSAAGRARSAASASHTPGSENKRVQFICTPKQCSRHGDDKMIFVSIGGVNTNCYKHQHAKEKIGNPLLMK